ncbi:MAG: STN domain-containing protein, partial [Sphingobacteriaceae bacterium]|nr:STN domain-containing protein [Sphingobacteriaceae bacterium]
FSQDVSISVKNAPLTRVFDLIEKQTDYVFFFDYSLIEKSKKITFRAAKLPLRDVLDACFKDQPFGYDIVDKTIVIKENAPQGIKPIVDVPVFVSYRGKLVGEDTQPLSGAYVIVKGTDKGTQLLKKEQLMLRLNSNLRSRRMASIPFMHTSFLNMQIFQQ